MKIQSFSKLSSFLTIKQKSLIEDLISDHELALSLVGKWMDLNDDGTLRAIVLDSSNDKLDLLELHLKYCDLHITLFGSDIIYLGSEKYEEVKAYLPADDVKLVRVSHIEHYRVDTGYFALINTGIAHTNVLTPGSLKMVVKLVL
ncbi:YhcH/YjgK/YiaL family protein [Schleiferiaceae bacterium]|nr:YhcH/YjgK/YiaL family protein [Schleiferiaceae bacterium]